MSQYSLGLSPCPNDTFIFHALLSALVPFSEGTLVPVIADVEELNNRVRAQALDISKVSLGAFATVCDDYCLLDAGAALGFGCGPLVVAREPMDAQARARASVAIPGVFTTANLLLNLTGAFQGERRPMLFSDIIPAVASGAVDVGVLIHEGRFTYRDHGLVQLLDLGAWWEEHYHIPLPLGAIAVRRSLAVPVAKAVERAIAASLSYAWDHPEASKDFVAGHAQELSEAVIAAHIKTFVTPFSRTLGPEGRAAVTALVRAGRAQALLPEPSASLFLEPLTSA